MGVLLSFGGVVVLTSPPAAGHLTTARYNRCTNLYVSIIAFHEEHCIPLGVYRIFGNGSVRAEMFPVWLLPPNTLPCWSVLPTAPGNPSNETKVFLKMAKGFGVKAQNIMAGELAIPPPPRLPILHLINGNIETRRFVWRYATYSTPLI